MSLYLYTSILARQGAAHRRAVAAAHYALRSPRRWRSSVRGETDSRPAASPLSAKAFASVAPMALLCQALRRHTQTKSTSSGAAGGSPSVITRSVFEKYCQDCHVRDPAKALLLLDKTGTVVSLDGGKEIHLRPAQYLHMCEDAMMSDKVSTDFFLDEVHRRIEAAKAEELSMRQALLPAVHKAARWRRVVWGAALCFAGAQLALISRLTFFDFDWDIMEPVSYFLGTGTSIMFYLYFIRYGRSLNYTDFDKVMLPERVKKFAPQDFDWDKYKKVCQKIEDEELMAEKIREWLKRH